VKDAKVKKKAIPFQPVNVAEFKRQSAAFDNPFLLIFLLMQT